MDPEAKELLRRNMRLTEENNALLRKMHRGAVWASVFRAIYWIVIVGTGIASFYYLNPYLKSAQETYLQVKAGADKVSSYKDYIPKF